MHGVYLAPWTCKVFRGRFLCAIYKFSFIHSHTATPEALCYTTPGQKTKQRTKLPLAQWPGTALRCWGLSRWWTWVSPQRSRPWTRPAGTPALQPPAWPSAQRLLSSCWAGPCPAGSGQREQEGVQEWSLITGADVWRYTHLCMEVTTITIYFIHPSGKLKLSFDRTTKNISH